MSRNPDRHDQLAQLLKSLRVSANLTQTEIAGALGKPQSYVSKYESGERRLDLIELEDLCRVLGTSLKDLVISFQGTSHEG